ncbi:MAG: tRNA (adenosine(37)-N6)-dimethylallyltransferase MiaA, partial [Chloroflexi bacterium]|nr:tRNA (adenosine(37)-N6)-dimethylallyltransferase MiaA [Chloroflexota bacterium]
AMSGLGYKQIGEYLQGECDLPEAIRRIKSETRQFVRRQGAWFRESDPGIRWFDVRRAGVKEMVGVIEAWRGEQWRR